MLDRAVLAYGGRLAAGPLSGRFEAGLATAVVGPNGSGKSTLLKALAGALRPSAGEIRLDGLAAKDVAYLPQEPGVDRAFPIDLEDFVALGFSSELGLFGGLGAPQRARLMAALAEAGLTGLERRPIGSLSGGQFQRALFARTAVQRASLVLLDEPFAALDAQTCQDLEQVTRRWSEAGRIVAIVLHDFDLARRLCPRTLVLARDLVAWGPTETVLTPDNLDRAQAMARHWPSEAAA